MESLSFKDIKVGLFYKISIKQAPINFIGFMYYKEYYVRVDEAVELGTQLSIKGSFFLQDTFGVNKCFYDTLIFEKDAKVEQVSYDAVREQETKEELKREIAEHTAMIFEAMDRRFEQHRRSYLIVTIVVLIFAALSVANLIIGL